MRRLSALLLVLAAACGRGAGADSAKADAPAGDSTPPVANALVSGKPNAGKPGDAEPAPAAQPMGTIERVSDADEQLPEIRRLDRPIPPSELLAATGDDEKRGSGKP